MRRVLDKVALTCQHCGEGFAVNGAQALAYESRSNSTRKYCSPRCFNEAKKIPVPTFSCERCGKVCDRTKNRKSNGLLGSYNRKQRFCSRSCAISAQPRKKGSFKGGVIDKCGYRLLMRDGTYVPEHRQVMETVVGRRLLPAETVHHINGVRLDNRPENLELWATQHSRGQRVTDQVAWAIELLKQYPEFAEKAGYRISSVFDEQHADNKDVPVVRHLPASNGQVMLDSYISGMLGQA